MNTGVEIQLEISGPNKNLFVFCILYKCLSSFALIGK